MYVTILILVDGFLQFKVIIYKQQVSKSHNHYFSRWFSAIVYPCKTLIVRIVTILILVDGFLQSLKFEVKT